MNTLHWLIIWEHIKFKICMYVFKCLQGSTPEYLTYFLSHKLKPTTGSLMWSSGDTSLLIAHVGKHHIGDKSFYVSAPPLWNSLPRNIREACLYIIQYEKGLKVSFISILLTSDLQLFILLCMFFMALWSCLERRLINFVCMYVCLCLSTSVTCNFV